MRCHTLSDQSEREPAPGFHVRFVHGERMTLAYWTIEAGAVLPEHSHPHEQIVNVLEGAFELEVNGDRRRLEPGLVAVVAPGERHGGRALTDCRIIDAFSPVREDYRA